MSNLSTQIATTREQSESLLAMGVNPETADMFYAIEKGVQSLCSLPYIDGTRIPFDDVVPAWSLSRLISMMPHYIYSIPYHLSISHGLVKYTHPSVGDKIGFCLNNMFDNCINMIDWLIKNNHFNKEYLCLE